MHLGTSCFYSKGSFNFSHKLFFFANYDEEHYFTCNQISMDPYLLWRLWCQHFNNLGSCPLRIKVQYFGIYCEKFSNVCLGHLLIKLVQNIFRIVIRFARYKETKFLYIDLWPIKLWSQYQYSHHFLWGTSVPYVHCLPNKGFPGYWADILTNKPTGSRKLTNKSTRNISRIQVFNYKDQCQFRKFMYLYIQVPLTSLVETAVISA